VESRPARCRVRTAGMPNARRCRQLCVTAFRRFCSVAAC
jgi:hypothetical protein